MLNIGGIIMAGGLALFASAQNNLMFYLAGALMGLGYGMSMALIPPALINNWFQAKRGLVLGIVLAGTGVGGLLWAAIGPVLAESDLGWCGVLWIMAGSMLACTVLPAVLLIRNDPAELGLPPYGAAVATERTGRPTEAPGFTFARARRSSVFWIAAGSFFLFGLVVAVTQVLSIVFRTAAYPNPLDRASWTPAQIAFYSSLFMVWLACLVLWKPLLGVHPPGGNPMSLTFTVPERDVIAWRPTRRSGAWRCGPTSTPCPSRRARACPSPPRSPA